MQAELKHATHSKNAAEAREIESQKALQHLRGLFTASLVNVADSERERATHQTEDRQTGSDCYQNTVACSESESESAESESESESQSESESGSIAEVHHGSDNLTDTKRQTRHRTSKNRVKEPDSDSDSTSRGKIDSEPEIGASESHMDARKAHGGNMHVRKADGGNTHVRKVHAGEVCGTDMTTTDVCSVADDMQARGQVSTRSSEHVKPQKNTDATSQVVSSGRYVSVYVR